MISLDAKIEALLFWKAEPFRISELGRIFGTSEDEVRSAVRQLETKLTGRGVVLLVKDSEVTLRTSPEVSETIEKLAKEELSRDLGRAGLETLSIILYQGPVSRREIDYIRGVNSAFIVRSLSVRGLIERIPNPVDERSFLYRPTFELLSYLGLAKIENLPEYETVREEIERMKKTDGSEHETERSTEKDFVQSGVDINHEKE